MYEEASVAKTLRKRLLSFRRERRGNVAITAALVAPVLLGSVGMGAEVASWYGDKRAMQNAADSAAVAAASNAKPGQYAHEARAVAASYGFEDGEDGIKVRTWNNVACPGGGPANCYRVTVSRTRPLLLAQVVGYDGDTSVDGAPAKLIEATAVAKQVSGPREYCVVALAGSGDPEALRADGGPKADLSGCSVMSNSGARCNGHDLDAEVGDAVGENRGCGKTRNSNVKKLEDPYAALVANLPEVSCPNGLATLPPKRKKDDGFPPENELADNLQPGVMTFCGDVQLISNTYARSGNTVLVIRDGRLDLQQFTLGSDKGAGLTVVFVGSSSSREHGIIGDGMLDFAAPTSGPWSGVAIYQSPSIPYEEYSYAGNSPTWKVTGLVYMPKANLEFKGAVNKSSNGLSCFVLVVDSLRVSGTGSILTSGQCASAGLKMPTSDSPSRGQLVS